MTSTPLNEEALTECVDMILEVMGYPRHRLFEYPHRDDDSRRYIQTAERTLEKILVLSAVPADTVNSVEELDALPKGTILRDHVGLALHKRETGNWWVTNGDHELTSDDLADEIADTDYSYSVLHRPVVES